MLLVVSRVALVRRSDLVPLELNVVSCGALSCVSLGWERDPTLAELAIVLVVFEGRL